MRKNIHIPWDITVAIFSKLPVKSLCRFKCLSKLFLSLINKPQFIKTHLSQSQRKPQKLLYIDGREFYSLDLEFTPSPPFVLELVALNLDIPIKSCIPTYASCNGLLFLSLATFTERYGLCWVYNPSTRELKSIPECNLVAARQESLLFHGFGYDDSTDDYKYVMITYYAREVFVYSLRTKNWKMLPGKFTGCRRAYSIPSKFGHFLNGAVHWAVRRKNECVIAAFDFAEEKFKTFPMPTAATTSNVKSKDYLLLTRCLYRVGVLGDCLFAFYRPKDIDNAGQQLQLWVMKEYGVKESWTRICLPNPPSYPSTRFLYLHPLCLCRNGDGDSDSILMASCLEELMEDGTPCLDCESAELLACNIKDGTCRKIDIVGYKPTEIVGYMPKFMMKPQQIFVESLVSPFK